MVISDFPWRLGWLYSAKQYNPVTQAPNKRDLNNFFSLPLKTLKIHHLTAKHIHNESFESNK